MDFTPTQLSVINLILPFKYKIEQYSKSENKPSKPIQRKTEAENLRIDSRFPPRVPEKRMPDPTPKPEEPLIPKKTLSEGAKKLQKILSELKKHEKAKFFLSSIDKKSFPDFSDKIKDPIDLSTVESRLNSSYYKDGYQFAMDMRKIWNNSFSYFSKQNSEIYSAAVELSIEFENLMRGNEEIQVTEKTTESLTEKTQKPVAKPEAKPKPLNDKPLGYLEKKDLCENIKRLDSKHLKGLLDIVRECSDMKGEELEFDLDKLPPKTCRQLDAYVKHCNSGLKPQKKDDPKPVHKEVRAEPEVQKKVEEIKNDVYLPEESESESSSTSESEEEEIPGSGFSGILDDDFDISANLAKW